MKVTFIIGSQGSGKTTKARELAKAYEKPFFTNSLITRSKRKIQDVSYKHLEFAPDVIIIDELNPSDWFWTYDILRKDVMKVNPKGKSIYEIEMPDFIIVAQKIDHLHPTLFYEKAEVIDLD